MAEKTVEKKRSPFVERVPELRSRKWGGMEKGDGEAVVGEILQAGKPAVVELIDGLREVDNGADWKERLLLYQLLTQCSVPERKKERAMLAEVFVDAALSKRPAAVRSFLLQQLRLFGDVSLVPRLGPLLKDGDPLVLDAASSAMVSIGEGARKTLEEAQKGAQGHAKAAITHALNQIGRL